MEVMQVEIFFYLLGISVIFLLYSIIWKYVFILPITLLLVLMKMDKPGLSTVILNALGYYILSSLMVLYTIGFVTSYEIPHKYVAFTIASGVLLLLAALQEIGQKSNDAERERDYYTQQAMPFTIVGCLLGLIIYVIAAIQPTIIENTITIFVLKLINNILHVNILQWILSIVGGLYLLNMAFFGLMALLGMFVMGGSKIFGRSA
jgi:hypothetical protein